MAANGLLIENDERDFAIEEFLAAEQEKDLLRFSTAGSVDDGKSTLIGRLLYDSRSVYEDQVKSVTRVQPGQKRAIDFAQLTDGLRAEREQGITIDVAYRYFSTQRRKFIIADTPGHEQYTRNMATGASTADVAIVLIDARKGILVQSRRHATIASLLGIRHVVAAVNKMDLVEFSEEVFRGIERELRALAAELGGIELQAIPVSALEGDNVVQPSERTPWYDGPTLLEYLEVVPAREHEPGKAFRMAVQRVIRPHQHYRGFAGQIGAGTIRPGDAIVVLPSGRTSRVASITTFDGDLEEASAPQSIALTLEDELDISRGDVIAAMEAPPESATRIEAALVWFDAERLETQRGYLLKHGSQMVQARVTQVVSRTKIETGLQDAVSALGMNDIGTVEIETVRPLLFDPYAENRATGSFILIDARTNATVAAGMIRRGLSQEAADVRQKGAVLVLDAVLAGAVEEALLRLDAAVVRTRVRSERLWRSLLELGVVTLVEDATSSVAIRLGTTVGADGSVEVAPWSGAAEADAVAGIVRELQRIGVVADRKEGDA